MTDVTITVRSTELGDFEYCVHTDVRPLYDTVVRVYVTDVEAVREAIQQAIVSTAARAASAYSE